MTSPLPDPTKWLTDLLNTEHTVFWPGGDIAESSKAFAAAAAPWTKAVAELGALQLNTFQQVMAPWLAAMPGAVAGSEPIKDRRFAGEAWTKDPRFEAVARTYLAQTEAMFKALDAAPLDERSKAQWGFALRQVTDAISPANTLATNPEALQLAMETGGASLIEGMKLFTEDLALGRVQMTDSTAFEVGRNVCTTPGSVVFQNDLIQLIQYTPTTAKVHQRPLVIVPPCINKYYILDLQPANSFVAHAVAEGHTVFLVSWRNAGPEQAELTWDDYLEHGVLQAIDVALAISRADQVNTLGFCIGGTLLASALAVRAARDEHPASSMTLLTSMLDFTDTGEIGLLVTDGVGGRAGGGDRQRRPAQGQRAGPGVRLAPGQRPDLAVRGQGLPEGQATAGVRPALLEQRRHQPARADVLLVPAQHLPGEQAARAGRDHPVRRAGRPAPASRPRPSSTPPRKTTSCPGRRPTPARTCCPGTSPSCSGPAATSPG